VFQARTTRFSNIGPAVRRFGLIALFAAIVAVSGVGLLVQFPGMKEGISQEELPFYFGGMVALAVLGAVWWLAVGRSVAKALPIWIILAIPTIGAGATAVSLIVAGFEGSRLARSVSIENFSETPIHWPGFDGPVGLTWRFELVHPARLSALILPPEIRMGPAVEIPRNLLSASRTTGSGYFKDGYLVTPVGPLALLKTVVFQRFYENHQARQEYQKWTSALRFDAAGRTQIVYNLHPGMVDYLEGPAHLCLSSRSPGIPRCAAGQAPKRDGCRPRNRAEPTMPRYHTGGDLTALWIAAGSGDMIADFGPVLTATLRAESRLQADTAAWTAIQKRLESERLRQAGYRLCPSGDTSHTASRVCFCRDRDGTGTTR
jgi:hypothetical protein